MTIIDRNCLGDLFTDRGNNEGFKGCNVKGAIRKRNYLCGKIIASYRDTCGSLEFFFNNQKFLEILVTRARAEFAHAFFRF